MRWARRIAAAAALLLAVQTALAQEAGKREGEKPAEPPPARATLLPGVTVTATKTQRAIEEVPESVTVIDQEQLQQEQAKSIGDVLKDVPNVEMEGGPRRTREQPVIRGMTGGRVVVQIDGARQNFESGHQGSLFVEPDLLKRVEILRGPASALYGSDALGGVLTLTTKDPGDFLLSGERFGAQVRTGYQSAAQEKMVSPAVYGRLGDDWSFLLYGTRRVSEDIRTGGGDLIAHSGDDISSSLAKLVWDTPDAATVRFSFQNYADVQEIPQAGEFDDPTGASLVDRVTRTRTVAVNYATNGLVTGLWNPYVNAYSTRMDIEERGLQSGRVDEIAWTTHGIELRNSSFIPGDALEHTLTYGLEYTTDEERASRDGEELLVFPNASAVRSGLYVQDELKLGPWRITPGIRHDTFSTRADSVEGANNNQHVSPKLGVVYTVNPVLNVHALYAQGFRAPGIQELYISGLHFGGVVTGIFVPNPDLKPERSVNTEAGFTVKKTGWLDPQDQLLVRAAAFRNEVSQFIDFAVYFVGFNETDSRITCTNGGGCQFFKPVNINRARLTGDEVEASYTAPQWKANLSFSQIRGVDLELDEPLNSTPPDKLVVSVQRAFAGGEWWVGGRRTQVETQDRVTVENLETPGYVLMDAFATYEPKGGPLRNLRVDAGMDNIADVEYRRHMTVLKQPGRNYKVTLGYRF